MAILNKENKIFLNENELEKFSVNGFSQDDVKSTINDYRSNGIPDEEIVSKINSRLDSFDKPIEGKIEKVVNITPSNIIKSAKAGVQAPAQMGINALENLINSGKDKDYYQGMQNDLSKLMPSETAQKITTFNQQNNAPKPTQFKETYGSIKNEDNTPDWLIDLGILFALPELAPFKGFNGAVTANKLLTGAYQGGAGAAIESLGQKGFSKDTPLDIAKGAAIGGGVVAGLPVLPAVGNSINKKFVSTLKDTVLNKKSKVLDYIFEASRLKPETIRQVIKPNSKALEMTKDEASILLTDTVKNLQKAFGEVEHKYAQPVNEALKQMMRYRNGTPKEYAMQPNVKKVELYNLLDSIFDSDAYSLSGNPELNIAYKQANHVYDEISDLIQGAQGGENTITGPELYDVMRNIKNKVKWDTKNPAEDVANQILERAYGAYSGTLKDLWPMVKRPFKNFEELQRLKSSEGVRKILQNPELDKVEGAATALKNHWSTMSKGSSAQNIRDLEALITKNNDINPIDPSVNFEPFMDKIDDINAVEELEQIFRTGNPTIESAIRTFLAKPVLRKIRDIDKTVKKPVSSFSGVKNALPYFAGANGVIPSQQFKEQR